MQGEWVNLVIVNGRHLILWTILTVPKDILLFHLLLTKVLQVTNVLYCKSLWIKASAKCKCQHHHRTLQTIHHGEWKSETLWFMTRKVMEMVFRLSDHFPTFFVFFLGFFFAKTIIFNLITINCFCPLAPSPLEPFKLLFVSVDYREQARPSC